MVGRSPKEAWNQTRSDWKPELLYGIVGGVLSVVILTITGWPDGRASYLIPTASVLGAALVVPLAQFVWRLAWQPWETLKSDIAAIRSQGAPPPPPEAKSKKPTNARLTVVNAIRKGKRVRDSSDSYARWERAAEAWIDEVTHFLAEHVSADATERFLTATDSKEIKERINARLAVLDELLANELAQKS